MLSFTKWTFFCEFREFGWILDQVLCSQESKNLVEQARDKPDYTQVINTTLKMCLESYLSYPLTAFQMYAKLCHVNFMTTVKQISFAHHCLRVKCSDEFLFPFTHEFHWFSVILNNTLVNCSRWKFERKYTSRIAPVMLQNRQRGKKIILEDRCWNNLATLDPWKTPRHSQSGGPCLCHVVWHSGA